MPEAQQPEQRERRTELLRKTGVGLKAALRPKQMKEAVND